MNFLRRLSGPGCHTIIGAVNLGPKGPLDCSDTDPANRATLRALLSCPA